MGRVLVGAILGAVIGLLVGVLFFPSGLRTPPGATTDGMLLAKTIRSLHYSTAAIISTSTGALVGAISGAVTSRPDTKPTPATVWIAVLIAALLLIALLAWRFIQEMNDLSREVTRPGTAELRRPAQNLRLCRNLAANHQLQQPRRPSAKCATNSCERPACC